jgi:hypothetical protein
LSNDSILETVLTGPRHLSAREPTIAFNLISA